MIRLQSHIVFGEEEYKSLFCVGKNKASLVKLKALLKGRAVEGKISQFKYRDIEHFIFNSIPRETVPGRLFFVYKNLVQKLHYIDVIKFVRNRRYNSKLIKEVYIPLIAGMILYDGKLIENIDVVRMKTVQQNVIRGKQFSQKCGILGISSTQDIGSVILCSCSIEELRYINYNYYHYGINCDCCLYKMTSFADDCAIKIGKDLLKKKMYNFLLFSHQSKDVLVKDVLDIIGLIIVISR
jgi:hypothetical protein